MNLNLPEDQCPHDEIVPYGDGTCGRCVACGDDTFPLVDGAKDRRRLVLAHDPDRGCCMGAEPDPVCPFCASFVMGTGCVVLRRRLTDHELSTKAPDECPLRVNDEVVVRHG